MPSKKKTVSNESPTPSAEGTRIVTDQLVEILTKLEGLHMTCEHLKEDLERLDHGLMGNGRRGKIADLEEKIAVIEESYEETKKDVAAKHLENSERIKKIETQIEWSIRLFKWGTVLLMVMMFLSGSGTVTLEHLIEAVRAVLGH